ncbi:MAG: molybdenum transporter, partial [Candidatus Lokiarchaeota archaeon]
NIGIKYWLEFDNKSILGSGWANLLKHIDENQNGSLSQAAEQCKYSYKYAWNILKRIENRTGRSPVITRKGGTGGGGYVKLNKWGKHLLEKYNNLEEEVLNLKNNLKTELFKQL